MTVEPDRASASAPGLQHDFDPDAGGVVVTGGTGAVGSTVCSMLARRGIARIAFTYRNDDARADEVVAALEADGIRAVAVRADLTNEAAAASIAATAIEELGGVQALVHAAGPHVPQIYLSRVTPKQLRGHLDAEVCAFFGVVRPLLDELRERRGSVVAVTTAATRRYPIRDGLSSGPKAAVEALVKGLAAEEGRYGVRFNCVGPGMLTEGMAERMIDSGELDERAIAVARSAIPLRSLGSAADVAEAVCFLLSHRAGYVTGQTLDVEGGYCV